VCVVRANVRAALHIQHRRPNGWADRGPHWYKHLLGQWAEVMGVGDRECALMHHLSSIGARRSGPIEPQMGTKTHWENGHRLGGQRVRSARSAQSGRCCRPARARRSRTSAKRESTGMEQDVATPVSAKYERWARAARISRLARSKKKRKKVISDRHMC
jgi:hypothetical protein